jgi:hypothetical protein
MASVVIKIVCDGEVHRIELRDDGTARMLDHDPRVVAAFTRMGATPPLCYHAKVSYEELSLHYILETAGMEHKTLSLLACDYAEHVLPIFEHYHPQDDRPRVAIEAARIFLSGNSTRRTLGKARVDAEKAVWNAASKSGWAAQNERNLNRDLPANSPKMASLSAETAASKAAYESANAARSAVDAALTTGTGVPADKPLTWTSNAADWAVRAAAKSAAAKAWEEEVTLEQRLLRLRSRAEMLRSMWETMNTADAAEQAWQLEHTIKVLNAVEEGKPWPAL